MAGRIEFLDAEPPPVEPTPHRTPTPRNRRRTVAVVVAVAALVVGLLVARAVGSGDSAAPAPSATQDTRTATPDSSLLTSALRTRTGSALLGYCAGSDDFPEDPGDSTAFTVVPNPAGGARTEIARPGAPACSGGAAVCPGAAAGRSQCATSSDVPARLVDEVDRRYPGARLALATTETLSGGRRLWYRLLLFTLPGGNLLRIDVLQRSLLRTTVSEVDHWVDGHVDRAGSTAGDLAVLATVAGTGAEPDLDALTDLAGVRDLAAIR